MDVFKSLAEPILAKYPELDATDLACGPAPKLELGDVALRMFEAARKLKTPPPKLALEVAALGFGPEVRSATAAGPYVNFRLDRPAFARTIVASVLGEGGHYGSNDSGAGRKALIEHTSINPNASPHVGRARNAMIGDSLGRLLRFEGYDTDVQYYVNDMGRQIGLLVLVCDDLEHLTFDQILGRYVEANARAKDDPEFAQEGYDLLAKMEEGDADTRARFHAVTELCLKGQVAVLARLGASYDTFVRESEFIKDARLDPLLEALRESGALFTDEKGRQTVDLAKIGYPHEEGRFVPLLRSNGSSLYVYRDLAYTMYKFEQGADLNIAVFGEDHKLRAQQVELLLSVVGRKGPEVVTYSYILLKEGKMSTRQGNVVLLSDFLDQATARSLERVREQCTELTAEEQEAIAAQVAVAAIRFAILRVGPNKNVVFDWDASLSFTGDTGPYVQYSCARISSILRKFGDVPPATAAEFPIETDTEWALLVKLASFPECVAASLASRNCAGIAQFALETARLFTAFYHDCPVLAAETPEQRVARAQVCAASRQTLENALNLLGMEALEQM